VKGQVSGGDAQEVDGSGRFAPKVTVNGSVTLLDKVRYLSASSSLITTP